MYYTNIDMILHKNIDSLEATRKLANKLAANLMGGEVIELVSDVGGGKTTFTKFLVAALGSTDVVSSPTFTVSKTYHAPLYAVHHYDLYRLNDPNYVAEALDEHIQDPKDITIIEWGGIVEDVLPMNRVKITITKHPTDESSREVSIETSEDLSYVIKGIS